MWRRTGLLTIAVALAAAAPAGAETSLVLTSEPGDSIGQGQSHRFVDGENARIAVSGVRGRLSARVDVGTEMWWDLRFGPRLGQRLRAGRTFGRAQRAAFNGVAASLEVTSTGRGCNMLSGKFSIRELTWWRGRVRTLVLSFEQHCENKAPALRGTLRYHAGQPGAPRPRGGSFAYESVNGIHQDRLAAGQQALQEATAALPAGGKARPRRLSAALRRELAHYRAGARWLRPGDGISRGQLRSVFTAIASERAALRRYDSALRAYPADNGRLSRALQRVLSFWR
jgi:hypothetical protein